MGKVRKAIFILAILFIFLSSGCVEQNKLNTVNFGYKATPGQLAGVVAVEKGFLNEQDINIVGKNVSSGKEIVEAAIAKQIDIGLASSGAIIAAYTQEADLRIIAGSSYGGGRKRIMVKTGIEASKIEDLKGKKIAIQSGGTVYKDFLMLLKQNNLNEGDFVVLRDFKGSNLVPSLEAGRVDAIICAEPQCAVAEAKGIGKELLNFEAFSLDPNCLFVRKEFLDKNPETIKRFLKAWIKAEKFINENREEAIRLMSEEAGEEYKIMELASRKTYYDARITDDIIKAYEEDAQFLYEEKEIKNQDINGLFYLDYLNELLE